MRDGSGCRRQTNDEIAAESSKIDVVDEMKDSTTATAPSGLEIASTRCQTPLEMHGCTIEGCESRQIHRTPCKQGRRAFSDFSDFLIFFARLAPLANSLQSAVSLREMPARLLDHCGGPVLHSTDHYGHRTNNSYHIVRNKVRGSSRRSTIRTRHAKLGFSL